MTSVDAEARAKERAEIVAWLRAHQKQWEKNGSGQAIAAAAVLQVMTDGIEAGEHLPPAVREILLSEQGS